MMNTNKPKFWLVPLTVILGVTVVSVNAQNVKPLNEVVVTASNSPKKVGDIGKIVKVIDQQELEKAQGRSLGELLNTVVGLNVVGSNSNLTENQTLALRGSTAGNVLVLIDGIAVNDASSVTNDYNLASFTTDQIERIEILKGASSTLWGSDAVAGVINIITKKGQAKPVVSGVLSAGSFGTHKESIGFNAKLNQTNVAVNVLNLTSNGFSAAQSVDNSTNFEKDSYQQNALNANLGHQFNSKLKVNFGANYSRIKSDFDYSAFTDKLNYENTKKSLLLNLGAYYQLNKGEVNVVVSQNNVDNNFDDNALYTSNKGKITNVQSVFNYQIAPFLSTTSGVNYKYSETNQKSPYGVLSADTAHQHLSSLYTSLFFKKGVFRNELGGRYNYHNQYGDNFTYTINPSVLLAERYKLYLNVASAYKTPSLYQLTSEFKNDNGLKPETTYNQEFGTELDLVKDKLFLTAAVFKRKIKDVINFGFDNNRFQYQNKDIEKAKGYELELSYALNAKIKTNAYYTYTNAYVVSNGVTQDLMRRPKNMLAAKLDYQISNKLLATVMHKWTDKRDDVYFDEVNFNSINVNLKAYHKTDVYVQYAALKNVLLFVDAKNIFDNDFNDIVGYTTAGFNFNAGLSVKFQ